MLYCTWFDKYPQSDLVKTNTLIYIYIYIYCHPQTDCFVVSQLFSVAKYVGRLKLGSKPAQLYVRLSIRPLGQQAYYVGKGIIRYYVATAAAVFVCLHFIPYRIPECSIRSKSFALCKRLPKIHSPEYSTPMGGVYILSLCVRASVFHKTCNSKEKRVSLCTSLCHNICIMPSVESVEMIVSCTNFIWASIPSCGGLVTYTCRIHRLYLCRGVRLLQRVSWIWHQTIWWWGSSNAGGLGIGSIW